MFTHFIALLVVSYVFFVFISNFYNPFVIVKGPLRRRNWRLGRAVALASLVAGMLAIVMMDGYHLSARDALAVYLLMLGVFSTPSIIKHRRNSIWGQIADLSK